VRVSIVDHRAKIDAGVTSDAPTDDEARRVAASIAKLPDLLARRPAQNVRSDLPNAPKFEETVGKWVGKPSD
jgi:hypothetical protein